jgi:hypothetical protein
VFVEALGIRVAKAPAATLRVPAGGGDVECDVLLGGFTEPCRGVMQVAVPVWSPGAIDPGSTYTGARAASAYSFGPRPPHVRRSLFALRRCRSGVFNIGLGMRTSAR